MTSEIAKNIMQRRHFNAHASMEEQPRVETGVGKIFERVMKEVDPNGDVELEAEVEFALLHLLDDFVYRVTQSAVLCADHRGSNALEVTDLKLALEMDHQISVPGYHPKKRQRTD